MHRLTGRSQKHSALFSNFAWAPHRPQAVLRSRTPIFGNSSSSSTRCIIHFFFRKIFKFTEVISSSQKSNFCTFLELIPRMSSFSNLTYQNFQYDLSICEDRCLGRCFSKMCKTDEADPFADYTTDTNNQLFGLLF